MMELGTSFLNSKLARRFVSLFLLCAFLPTLTLIVLSYRQVVNQLEEQSYIKLKREVKAYSLSLFDRMIRIDNELVSLGQIISPSSELFSPQIEPFLPVFEELFVSVIMKSDNQPVRSVFGVPDGYLLHNELPKNIQESKKPFIIAHRHEKDVSRFFFGANIRPAGAQPFTLIAEVKPDYLWGIGVNPILPPMTALCVYDETGKSLIASDSGFPDLYKEIEKKQFTSDLHIFQFENQNKVFHAGVSNLFIESRFQRTDWTIILARDRKDIMSSLDHFKTTFPVIILLFLLLIIYLSLLFIRKGLLPLERLKEGTKKIASGNFSTQVKIESGDEFEELGKSFDLMAANLQSQFNTLTVLGEIDRAVLSSLDRVKTIKTTLQRMKTFFHCEVALFVRISEDSPVHAKLYTMEGRRIQDPEINFFPFPAEEQGKIFVKNDHVILQDIADSPQFLNSFFHRDQELFFLCLPLTVKEHTNRALLLGRVKAKSFSPDELAQARKIANQLAIAIANSILVENLEQLARGTIEALARTVDAKSKWTSGHSERVAILSGDIGRIMHLSERQIETLMRGGLLHDIGKIGIPVKILDKPDRLTEEEYNEIKTHPELGTKILEPIDAFHDILPVVGQHHERYDGSGYPMGLSGSEIDIRARILAVADVWDALVSDRPYRNGWMEEKAKKMIIEGSGTHYDPDVVNAFLTAVSNDQ